MTIVKNSGFYAMKPESIPRQVVLAFRDDFSFLSNFASCAVTLAAEENLPAMEFDSTEKAYMAWKTTDLATRVKIQSMMPDEAKQFSHQADFPLRADFNDENRIDIMLDLNRQKYSSRNPDLAQKLLATGDAVLIEGNDWADKFFGFDYLQGCGSNHLGQILMKIRKEIGGL